MMNTKKKTDKIEEALEAFIYTFIFSLLQRNEAGRVSGSNTRTTVLNRLVCDGEFSKVMTDHLRLKRDTKQMNNYKTVLIHVNLHSIL